MSIETFFAFCVCVYAAVLLDTWFRYIPKLIAQYQVMMKTLEDIEVFDI